MEEKQNYGYYSKVLNKPFDTVEELLQAEAALEAANQAAAQKKAEKKEKADAVLAAYKNYVDVTNEGRRKVKELSAEVAAESRQAYEEYCVLEQAFIREYGSFHMTYTDSSSREPLNVFDILNDFITWNI